MTRGQLGRNVVWNIAEVIGSSVVLFILYKLVLTQLGVTALGVWSLVLATTSLARMADLGAAGGLGRYVAVTQAKGGSGDAALVYVETALITNGLFYLALGALLYWPAWYALGFVTHGEASAEARRLLPYAIGSFALLNVSNVVTAALTGFHRSYQKSAIVLGTLVIQVALAAVLVKTLGLRAIAIAQIVQYALVTALGWFLTVRIASGRLRLVLPHRFGKTALKELVAFGLRLQILNLASFPFEPITKFVFSAFGGLPALGVYELASRGILQVRQVVIAPSQNLTPLFAAKHHTDPQELKAAYQTATANIMAAAGVAMALMALGSPAISYIWMGHVDPAFVVFSLILALGWFFNIAATPAYFLGLAAGRLRWNIVGSALSTLSAGVLGALLARPFGGAGVAAGAMLAIAAGGLLTWKLNCRDLGFRMLPAAGAWVSLYQAARRAPGAILARAGMKA